MYYVNKLAWFILSPMTIILVMLGCGVWMLWRAGNADGKERRAIRALGAGFVLASMVVWAVLSMPITAYVLGNGFERRYQEVDASDAPVGDVAIDFGGSPMRAWYAAELIKAGKAKWLIPSSENTMDVDVPLMHDLGVKDDLLLIDDRARNTEENVKFSKKVFEDSVTMGLSLPFSNRAVRVLVVTSAVHMPRCMLMMEKYWPEAEAIPVACDFQTTKTFENGWRCGLFKPNMTSFMLSEAFVHEYIGYAYYKWLRF